MWPFMFWLLSLSIMASRFICMVARISTPFIFVAEYYSIVWIEHMLCIHSSVVMCCFYLLAIMNNVYKLLCGYIFSFPFSLCLRVYTGSCGNSTWPLEEKVMCFWPAIILWGWRQERGTRYCGADPGRPLWCPAWQCYFYGHNKQILFSPSWPHFPETNDTLGSLALAISRDFWYLACSEGCLWKTTPWSVSLGVSSTSAGNTPPVRQLASISSGMAFYKFFSPNNTPKLQPCSCQHPPPPQLVLHFIACCLCGVWALTGGPCFFLRSVVY